MKVTMSLVWMIYLKLFNTKLKIKNQTSNNDYECLVIYKL